MSKELFFEQQEQEMHQAIEAYENGDVSALDVAVQFKKDMLMYEYLTELRKDWIDENKDAIDNESEKWGGEYGGFKITKQYRETLSFKHIPEWSDLEAQKKEVEKLSKLALQMVRKGGLNVDENGEEIPLPEIKSTSFVKFEKLKNN